MVLIMVVGWYWGWCRDGVGVGMVLVMVVVWYWRWCWSGVGMVFVMGICC